MKTEMYYDMNGKPMALSQGQYGILIENGLVKNLKANGHKQINIKQYLYTNHLSVISIALALTIISSILLRKRKNVILFILYLAFIWYITLMNRESNGTTMAEIEPFWSYKQILSDQYLRMEILKNIWLFVPLGSIMRKLWSKGWVILIAVALSAMTEIIQFFTGLGLAEFDDVISNGIGSLIGFGYCYVIERVISFIKNRKARHFK